MNPLLNNNMTQLMSQFNQFRQSFRGNPKEMVMQMLNNGQISQEQLKQAQEMAKQFQNMMGVRK